MIITIIIMVYVNGPLNARPTCCHLFRYLFPLSSNYELHRYSFIECVNRRIVTFAPKTGASESAFFLCVRFYQKTSVKNGQTIK